MRLLVTIAFSLLSSVVFANVQEFTLSNGLKILVKEDHRAPVVVSMVWYNVGSADEPGGLTGVSHALEHFMFKGTAKYPLGIFSKTIAAIGGEENAFTNYDYTAYYEKIAANQLPIALELEADRMENLLFSANEFSKEIKVIQEERRLRTDDNPQALAFERYLAAAHLTDPYHHPVIGWMSDLKQMTVRDATAWYNNFYAPNNAKLIVVGDVTASKVFDLAKLYFGHIKRRPDYIRKPQKEPPALGEKTVTIYAAAKLPMLMFGYTVPSIKTAKKPWEPFALEIIANLLDDPNNSGRLAKDVVRAKRIASNIEAYYSLYSRYQTQFIFFGTPTQTKTLKELKLAILQEINRLQKERVSEEELKRIKTQIIAQKMFEKDSIFGQAMELGLLETLGLSWQTATTYIENIQAVTPEQIQETATRYFNDNNRTVTELFPLSLPKEKQ